MKILVTGGCGFVGSNLSIFLSKNLEKSKIFSLDNFSRAGSKLNYRRLAKHRIKNFNIDISKSNSILSLPKFDLIIDCCAEASVEESKKNLNKVFNTNLYGTFNILKKCAKDKTNIIFLSSSRVYSINTLRKIIKKNFLKKEIKSKFKINENFDTKNPKSLYGLTKLSSEELVKEFSFIYNIKYIINRFGVISGPWQFGKQDQGFFSLWLWKHYKKKNLSYIGFGGNGYQIRDVLHIYDACNLVLKQIRQIKTKYNDTFNIGGGIKNSLSLNKLTKICEKKTGNKIKFKKIKKTSIYDIPYYVTDNSKVSKNYSWQPKHNLDKIADDILYWIKKNNKNLIKYIK